MRKIKTKKNWKAMALLLALLLPMGVFAQGGLFQRGDGDELYYGQSEAANKSMLLRDGEMIGSLTNQGFGNSIGGSDLTNQTFGVPLGSGLFVLLLAGVGYSVLKSNKKTTNKERKYKMKKTNIILVAFALVVIMTQCKKNEEINSNETVTITFDAKRSNGSRVDVNTATGTVDFETGDKVYVGSGGKYVGFLTHNGSNFVGNITNPTEGQPLQFYFLGNVTPAETLTAGTTESCSVVISDQTEHLPVISCAASYENYVSGVTSYTGHLLNKCALVKFNVTTPSNAAICITGMHNKVTVDFSQNTMTPSIDGEGLIKLPAGSGENVEKWAILLPQEALEEGEEGSAYSEDGTFIGIRPVIPAIIENGYLAEGVVVIAGTTSVPVGAINGLFTINSNGDQVYFSQGNLQYQASTNTWRFAENQWDYVGAQTPENGNPGGTITGSDNSNISSSYDGWIDLFGWGTSGWTSGAKFYQPWSKSTLYSNYYPGGSYTNNLTGSYARADWGVYNGISNGGNQASQWRTLTGDSSGEWYYVFNTRNTSSGIRYAKAQVAGVNGVILVPDDWNTSTYSLSNTNTSETNFNSNVISASQWITLENAGAVFLPAAGFRNGSALYGVGIWGYYWSSSYYDSVAAGIVLFSDSNLYSVGNDRSYGHSVRLVCACQ